MLNLNETVEDMLKMLRRLIGEDIDLWWKPGPDPGTVKMDPAQIDQILASLCVNARDAIAGVGKVTIEKCKVAFEYPNRSSLLFILEVFPPTYSLDRVLSQYFRPQWRHRKTALILWYGSSLLKGGKHDDREEHSHIERLAFCTRIARVCNRRVSFGNNGVL